MPDPDLLLSNVLTLGDMAARINRAARERIDRDLACDFINDAVESLFNAAILATLSKFVGRPLSVVIPADTTSYQIATIPDPTNYALVGTTAGGTLPDRTYEVCYAYVTDSGTTTRKSPAVTQLVAANTLATVSPPDYVDDAIGYFVYAGVSGRMAQQGNVPLPFDQMWIEPPSGVIQAPDGPLPPRVNTTGDNVYAIQRIDVANQDLTFTNWLQATTNSSAWTQYQNRFPVPSTFPRHAYDLINNNTVEFRPQAGTDLPTTILYTVRPRRLRFLKSRLPYMSFVSQPFIFAQSFADVLRTLQEDKSADSWQTRADRLKLETVLAIAGENFNRNDTVKQYMRY